jgi:hypothetical protein
MKNTSKEPTINAKRVREHRQRKKEGSRIYKLTIKPEQLDRVKIMSTDHRDRTPEELLHLMIDAQIARLDMTHHELSRLKELGADKETFDRYCQNEIKRIIPLTAEQFLSGER